MINDSGFNFENIAHELAEVESRLDLTLGSGAVVHMVWPIESIGFFWIEHNGSNVVTAAKAKEVLDRVGLVPTLTPIDRQEKQLSREHLALNVETKLASRHFRNNLRALQESAPDDYRDLLAYMVENTPEISSLDVEVTHRDGASWIDVYFRHPNSRVRKELFWAGDGLQIWLQILFHLWRTRDGVVSILDEPDVFLHPDLQRRMVRVVENATGQTILASHAAEVAGEASLSSLIWIDRGRNASRIIGGDAEMEQLSSLLGSAFNLSIARALRARTALFVEGKDMKILRVIAKTLGCREFASETGLAIVPIGGFSHWPSVEAFGWIKSQFLGSQVRVRVLLDRDYRSAADSETLVHKLALSDVEAHVWTRKELESYLLVPEALARCSLIPVEDSRELLEQIFETLKPDVLGQYTRGELQSRSPGEDDATVVSRASVAFERMWTSLSSKTALVPAKEALKLWNQQVTDAGGQMTTAAKIARSLRSSEIPSEMADFIRLVNSDLV